MVYEQRKNDFGITEMELFELNVIKTKGVFLLLLLGLLISLIVFLLEILANFLNEKKVLKSKTMRNENIRIEVFKRKTIRSKSIEMDTIYKIPKKVRPKTR